MAEIFKVPQHTGQRGRPRGIEIRGGKNVEDKEPEILGAAVSGEPTIYDRTSETQQPDVEVNQHSFEIHSGDGQIRSQPPKPGDPEVRIVTVDQARWDKVKRDEDEGS